MKWSERIDKIEPFYVMEVLAEAKKLESQGRDIIHMEVGEPDFATPAPVIRAAQQALENDYTSYTHALGLPELRDAVSRWYKEYYGVKVSSERVVITPGTSGGFILAFGVTLNQGDGVLLTDPGYPCYPNTVRYLGGTPIMVPTGPETDYQFSYDLLKPHLEEGARAALITSPSNPTGTLIEEAEFKKILEAGEASETIMVSDEIYHGITYRKRACTALKYSDQAIVINGFSKYFGMTGWRLGWMVVPEEAIELVEKLAQNLFISAPTLSQYAALAAFSCTKDFNGKIAEYDRKRLYLLDELRKMGFLIPVEPGGAFYIYADATKIIENTGMKDAKGLCSAFLREAGVAVTPGNDFGNYKSESHARFSYAATLERLREAVKRLKAFISRS